MSGSLTRQALAMVAAVAVVCSVTCSPAAAAAVIDTGSDGGLSGLSSDGQSFVGSDENSTADSEGEDEGAEDGEGDGGTDVTNGTENGTEANNSADDGDESSDDSATSDVTLRSHDESDAGSENESDDSATDGVTDRLEDTVNETATEVAESVENRSEDVQTVDVLDLDVDNSTAPNATAELVEVIQLDVDNSTVHNATVELVEAVQLDNPLVQGVVQLVEPLLVDDGSVDRSHTYDETVATNRDATPTATESTPGDGSDEETAATAVASSDEESDPADPAGAGAAMGLGALATAAALRGTPLLVGSNAASSSGWVSRLVDRVRPLVFPLRYSRHDDSDPLEHEARERVYEIVDETPGAYLSEVSKEAGLPLSTTRHHIRVLEREDLVTDAKLHGKRRFFPAYAEGKELAAALNDDSTASIIDAVARIGAASVNDLADELGRDPSTISHHLQRLEGDGVITRERDGRAVVSRLSAEARTALEPESAPETGESGEIAASSAD